MKIVNRSGVPKKIFEFLQADFYDYDNDPNAFSITTLLKPVQEIVLERRHWDEIEIDAMDRMWSVLGQGVHAVLEKQRGERIVRMKTRFNGVTVTGKYDEIDFSEPPGVIIDYKNTSAWTLVYGSRNEEWRAQLSGYRWLYWKENGVMLSNIGRNELVLRDWSEKNLKNNGYPRFPMVEVEHQLHKTDEFEAFLDRKIDLINEFMNFPDSQLQRCSDDERWWNEKQATFIKCSKYCGARDFCVQNKEMKHSLKKEEVK